MFVSSVLIAVLISKKQLLNFVVSVEQKGHDFNCRVIYYFMFVD